MHPRKRLPLRLLDQGDRLRSESPAIWPVAKQASATASADIYQLRIFATTVSRPGDTVSEDLSLAAPGMAFTFLRLSELELAKWTYVSDETFYLSDNPQRS